MQHYLNASIAVLPAVLLVLCVAYVLRLKNARPWLTRTLWVAVFVIGTVAVLVFIGTVSGGGPGSERPGLKASLQSTEVARSLNNIWFVLLSTGLLGVIGCGIHAVVRRRHHA
jgi:hypothetical protein